MIVGLGVSAAAGAFAALPEPATGMPVSFEANQSMATGQMHRQPRDRSDRSIEDYSAALEQAESRNGAYGVELIEPLQAIATALQSGARYAAAIEYYQRAIHLTRVISGLYAPAQVPLLKRLAASQNALGLYLQANETRDYLYRVQRHTMPALDTGFSQAALAHAQWKQQMYLHGAGGQGFLNLLESHQIHSRAVDAIAMEDDNNPALIPHLYGRMTTEYLISRYEGERDPQGLSFTQGYTGSANLEAEQFRLLRKYNFRNGRRTLLQVVKILEQQQPLDAQALAKAKVALGDWYLWWFQRARALESYEAAYRIWADGIDHRLAPAELFGEPVKLPAGQSLPASFTAMVSQESARARVRFRVSRHGEARAIEVLDVQAPSDRDQQAARVVVHKMLRTSRFRPVVREGKVVMAEPIEREYRFDY